MLQGAPAATSAERRPTRDARRHAGHARDRPRPGQSCQRDEDCTGDNICQANVCHAIQLRTNVAYLYYRDGGFTEFLGLYWSQKGTTGYRVVAPLYWHYWSPTTDTLIVAPFYWRFEDRAKRSLVTWYGPIVSGHRAGHATLVRRHSDLLRLGHRELGGAVPGHAAVQEPRDVELVRRGGYLYWWWRSPTRSTDLGFPIFFSTRTADHAFTFALPLNLYWRHETTPTCWRSRSSTTTATRPAPGS